MRWPARLANRLRARDGALTRELARAPGGFGLGQVPAAKVPEQVVRAVCGFCSTGCSLDVHLRDGQPVNLTPTADYPVNLGMACPKGWESLAPLAASDRATEPLLRDGKGHLRPVSWTVAAETFVSRFGSLIERHGPESVAFLSTGQIPTEEMAFLGAFAKFGMGIVHGDGNTRQCMATSVVAYKQAFGFDAPPYTYADFEESDVIVLVGSNLCIAHPIMWERVCRNPHSPEIVVIDPRATETAMAATQHLALRPKSDLVLLYGLANLLIELGWVDHRFVEDHTSGFPAFAEFVRAFPMERVVAATGLTPLEVERLASTIHRGSRVSFWWTMGVNQGHESTRTAQAIIALALLTGNIGRPGTGANSITGQCNAMGSRLFSNTTNLFGGRDFTSATDRADVAEILDVPASVIPDKPSLAYDQILEGVVSGRVRGLWIVATNTAHSWINQEHAREVLDRLDFLVVQDMYHSTDTARLADLVLPAAAWGEKDGTFINSERRVGVIRRVSPPPGSALPDFEIFRLLASAWGCDSMFESWTSPEAVFAILQRLSARRPCDISGVEGYEQLEAAGGIQWPFPADRDGSASGSPAPGSERRLFADGHFFHPDGRARFVFDEPGAPKERLSTRYPLVLLTGRGSSSQWHTGTRTSKSAMLRSLSPNEPYVEVSPVDASARGLSTGEWAVVASSRSTMRARVFVTGTAQPGAVFVPMHFVETNKLTSASFDPHSRQPSYKWAAVELRRPLPGEVMRE